MYEMLHFVDKFSKNEKGFPDKSIEFCANMQIITVFWHTKITYRDRDLCTKCSISYIKWVTDMRGKMWNVHFSHVFEIPWVLTTQSGFRDNFQKLGSNYSSVGIAQMIQRIDLILSKLLRRIQVKCSSETSDSMGFLIFSSSPPGNLGNITAVETQVTTHADITHHIARLFR